MNATDRMELTLKILTVGESGVGKTCLLMRYTDNKFIKNHLTTIGIDYKAKIINMNNKQVRLKIWDTAGQERFRNITQQYYKNADGILLIYDVSDRNSFEKVRDWMKQIQSSVGNEKIAIVLVGNKCDVDNRAVSNQEGVSLSEEFGLKYFETSALLSTNVEDTFNYLAMEIFRIKNIGDVVDVNNQTVDLIKNNESKNEKKCCK
jgi:small GTP-binding protein